MKIAFYLENRSIPDVDLSSPALGNPGCGGTEYLFAALPWFLARLQGAACTPVLFANSLGKLPNGIKAYQAKDVCEAARLAKNKGADFLVYRPRRQVEVEFLELIDTLRLPTIAWAHITPVGRHLRKIADTEYLKAVVCVEHEQCDLAQDTAIWSKLTYIVNGFDVDGFQLPNPPKKEAGLVVYLGALVPQKGFHRLARVWPRILHRHPEARLAVIGSGGLYRDGEQLGRWGVAEPGYEDKCIVPHLAGKDGRPHPSVRFMGKLGVEKKEILYRATVGVLNPAGQTENCPGSALEIQACGTAVVSGAYYGLLDTVKHGETGLLGRSDDDLVDDICSLLDNPNKAAKLGQNGVQFVRNRYGFSVVTSAWVDLFERLAKGRRPKHVALKRNLHRHAKWLISVNRSLQMTLGRFVRWPSVVEGKAYILHVVKAMKAAIS